MKDVFRWWSPSVEQEVQLVRWGHMGTPVLLFPTAGGDAEEIERFHLISVLQPLIDAGRIKIYSTDSIAGKAWFSGEHSAEYCSFLQNCFDTLIYRRSTEHHPDIPRRKERSARGDRFSASSRGPCLACRA